MEDHVGLLILKCYCYGPLNLKCYWLSYGMEHIYVCRTYNSIFTSLQIFYRDVQTVPKVCIIKIS